MQQLRLFPQRAAEMLKLPSAQADKSKQNRPEQHGGSRPAEPPRAALLGGTPQPGWVPPRLQSEHNP